MLSLFTHLIEQVEERWLRRNAKTWTKREATVTEQTVTGGWAPRLEIRYLFEVDGEPHEGRLARRYPDKREADSEPVYEAGAKIEVLVDPKNPDRSYFPLPLGTWEFVRLTIILTLLALVMLWGAYSSFEQRRFDAEHRIPESEWKSVQYSPKFEIRFPGVAQHSNGAAGRLAIDGSVPTFDLWQSRRENCYFMAYLYEYATPPAPEKVFALVRRLNFDDFRQYPAAEGPLTYLGRKTGEPVTWRGSTGRLFVYSKPAWAVEVYVSGRTAYLLSTDWYVQSNVRAFFDSMQPIERLN